MAYRLIELTAPSDRLQEARDLIDEEQALHLWTNKVNDDGEQGVLRVLARVEHTEAVMDAFTEKFETTDGFRLLLFNVEATLPRPDEDEEEKEEESGEEDHPQRISREELYTDISQSSRFSKVYVATIFLSVLVASVGLIQDNVAVIIGAMVIAPLLGPNVALALGATLGDLKLIWRSLKTAGGGLVIGLGVSLIIGFLWHIDPSGVQIESRTFVQLGDVLVALAAGSAGVLAFTRGIPAAIIGVMVAVALLPPLAVLGLLLGAGYFTLAYGAFVLVVVNIICINLSGILTFLVQGIRPRTWWEEKRAKRAVRIAMAVWVALLVVFVLLILYSW